MPLYLKLLNGFKVNYIVIYDRDHQAYKGVDAIASADISTLNIENAINSDYGKSIVFDNDIEEEIGLADRSIKNKPFIALNTVSATDYAIPVTLRTKIEEIYE